jgi:hypothetical protein
VVTSTVSILCCEYLKSVFIHTLYLCLLYDSLNRVIFYLNICNWFVSNGHRLCRLQGTNWTVMYNSDECQSSKDWVWYISHLVNSKVQQSLYRSGQALRVAEDWDFQISRQLLHEGDKVVSSIHRPPLPPQEIFLVLISVRGWVNPRAIVWPEGLCQWKIFSDTIRNRTRNLPVCSAVPQPTAPPHAPTWLTVLQLMDENHMGINRAVAEVNACLILLGDYMSCTHLGSHYLKSLLRFWTGAVSQNYIRKLSYLTARISIIGRKWWVFMQQIWTNIIGYIWILVFVNFASWNIPK